MVYDVDKQPKNVAHTFSLNFVKFLLAYKT